jgi:thymidylate synthase (FAD)
MYLRKPGWKTLRMGLTPWEEVDGIKVLKTLETDARLCYQSEGKMTEDSAIPFMTKRMNPKDPHLALLDHLHITAEYIADRGFSHELLRHKLTEIIGSGCVVPVDDFKPMAAMQESTRYCNYMKSGGVCFIIPPWITKLPEGEYSIDIHDAYISRYGLNRAERIWLRNKFSSEYAYLEELSEGWTPQMARGDLLIATKTQFRVTCSLTEWRHIFHQRSAIMAHPQMRELICPQLDEFKAKIPVLFDDIVYAPIK